MFALFLCIYLFEFLCILLMIFTQNKRPYRVLIWTIAFLVLPFLSVIIYLFFGCGFVLRKRKLNKIIKNNQLKKTNLKFNFENINKCYNSYSKTNILKRSGECDFDFLETMMFNINLHKTTIHNNQDIKIFRSGKTAFKEIFFEAEKAKSCIFVSTYIFATDKIGTKFLNLLIKKAKENVKIVLLYDGEGSRKTNNKFFNQLIKLGAVIIKFLPPKFNVNFYINYRNHRKIIVIDHFVSFVGGLNVRDDHLGENEKVSPWLDTHIKILGNISLELLDVIIEDLKLCAKQSDIKKLNALFDNKFFENYDKFYQKTLKFVQKNDKNNIKIQVLNSSCLYQSQKIEESFLFLINNAKNEIVIETPYLILDDKSLQALKQASLRGVNVKIIISKKPDKNFVYNASLYYANLLLSFGINVFLFNGFVHSKTILIDQKFFVCGSANFDMRSFNLNFETSIIVYDKDVAKKFYNLIKNILTNCEPLDLNFYKKLPVIKKLAIKFSKLFSPVL